MLTIAFIFVTCDLQKVEHISMTSRDYIKEKKYVSRFAN